MIRPIALLAALALAAPAAAQTSAPAPTTTVLMTIRSTQSGQTIELPSGPLEATASQTILPPHGRIAAHKHPYPRYVYVAEGRVKVTNLDTGKTYELNAGDVSVDPVGQWHEAEALGDGPARLIVVDQTPPGVTNVIRKTP
jgi:quercetin dioxygenase-like cupin family protein